MIRSNALRWLLRIFAAIALLAVFALIAAWWTMRGSLPRLEGAAGLSGLSASVRIERDARGVVTVTAANEADAMRALGFVHAQERFFEMDLMRRTAAGELAELFGSRALDLDRQRRLHRMRARVLRDLDRIAGNRHASLQAYTEGVNAGLSTLSARPWPYLLLRTQPQRWRPEDSALVGYAMYFDLQDASNARELALWRIKPHLPPALFALLTHDGSRWDAPVEGGARGDAALPGPDVLDLRKLAASPNTDTRRREVPERGSNSFAVSGAVTADGRAIVADDMHLGLRAPNIWFRARLKYADARARNGRVDVSGFTLPGLPLVVVGSNTHIAWGFTNSYGDWLDWQRVPPCNDKARASRCGISKAVERIRVAGQDDVLFEVEETAWGPIMYREPDGSALALRWVAHQPGSVTLGLADFAVAGTVDEALRAADHAGLPAQNLLVGDRSGRIAWRLLGPIPSRDAACDRAPVAARSGEQSTRAMPSDCRPWTLDSTHAVQITDPPSGRLWTANNRIVDGEKLDLIGDGGYVLGARGAQIRDGLFARKRLSERDLLAIQLDDRAVFLDGWWRLLRDTATRAGSPALLALFEADPRAPTHAAPASVSYRITRAWRQAVHERIADGLLMPARTALGDRFEAPALPQLEGVVWPLVTRRPPHLLPPRFKTWDALFEDAAREVRDELTARGPMRERTWGERNIADICHPLAAALPRLLRTRLCMPAEPLRGDTLTPRVQSPNFGASQRMVVSPGHERDGIIHMPGGQSGHRLSPFWGAGHDDWVQGRPAPFLPGAARYTLELMPPSR